MKKIFAFSVGFCLAVSVKAQLFIRVVDKETGKPLPGATVRIPSRSEKILADSSGQFLLTPGEKENMKVFFSYVGYNDTALTVSEIRKHPFVSLTVRVIDMSAFVMSATRSYRDSRDLPGIIEIIKPKEIEGYSAMNTDDLMILLPGITVDREFGIYSKSSSITLRGVSGGQRTLILLDGAPMNKADGGAVNWNRIDPDDIDHIEVVKGPASALYGGNAMGGLVNVVTRVPQENLEGSFKTFIGSYNTKGGSLFLMGKPEKEKGFYWKTRGFYRRGDGYINVVDSIADSTYVPTYLDEYGAGVRGGYTYGKNSVIEGEYSYWDDFRGDGRKIFTTEGGYNKYTTHAARVRWNTQIGKFKVDAYAYYQLENYQRQSESIKKQTGRYTLYTTDSEKEDAGFFITALRRIGNNQGMTLGGDLKNGSVYGSDFYKTSTDVLTNSGKIDFAALFVHDEISLKKNTWKFLISARLDYAKFYDGNYTIEESSAVSDFMVPYIGSFASKQWYSFSPKAGFRFTPNEKTSSYLLFTRGFRPPMLDDLCRSGNVNKGLKLANPFLEPENINNVELGFRFRILKRIIAEPTFYYTLGYNMMYFVGTGDSTFTGGDQLKPVIKRNNIAEVEIRGGEIRVSAFLFKNVEAVVNYAFNQSQISKFDTAGHPDKDLTGAYLTDVPVHQANGGIHWKNRFVNTGLTFMYRSSVWTDDENTVEAEGFSQWNLKFQKKFSSGFHTALHIQNIFNVIYINEKFNRSPGRVFLFEISYHFQSKNKF